MKQRKSKAEEIKALRAQIKPLQKQNEELQLEAYAHKTMVDIAEKESP